MFKTFRSRVAATAALALGVTGLATAQDSGASFSTLDLIDTGSIMTNAGTAVAGVVVTVMGIGLAFALAWAIYGKLKSSA